MRALVVTLFALVLVSTAADAEWTCPERHPDVDTGETPAGRFYVENDLCQPECLFSIWIYQESNGQDGLQYCSEVDDSPCWCESSDTILI